MTIIKRYLRWLILGGTLFFILKAFKDYWREVAAIRLDITGWLLLGIALIVTIVAHIWSGWVWTWILKDFRQPLATRKALPVYLTTNIAKYLPGNVWHFYGRINVITKAGSSVGMATLIVLLEPILMATAALLIALLSSSLGWISTANTGAILALQIVILILILVGIHPRFMNPLMQLLTRLKMKGREREKVAIKTYPALPLAGEIIFLLWRGSGFILVLMALTSINYAQIPTLLSGFSFAWLLGLVVPGAPGGLGVFEATAIATMGDRFTAVLLVGVALFRLISILAESLAALGAWIWERQSNFS